MTRDNKMGSGSEAKVHREREFHNQWAQSVDIDNLLVREAFESPTAIENRCALEELGQLQGKKLLDLGCGAGETSVYFALQGGKIYACDVADHFLLVAQALARRFGVHLCLTAAEAGCLPFESNFFDFVFGNGVLHHVELDSAASEIHRVLKPGGKAVFIEPLPYNPVINVYRVMASEVRTEDEKPLSFRQLEEFSSRFSSSCHQEFWLFSLLIFIYFYLIKRWHPSKVRYWKKVIEVGEDYKLSFSVLQKIDKFCFKYLPILRPLCWNTVLVVEK